MNRGFAVVVAVLFAVSVCGVVDAGYIGGISGSSTGTGASIPGMIINGGLTAPPGTADIDNEVYVKSPGNVSYAGMSAFPGVAATATVTWAVTNKIPDTGGPEDIIGYGFSIVNPSIVGATITSVTAPDLGWTATYDTVNGLWARFVANSPGDFTAPDATETLTLGITIPDFVDGGFPGEEFGLRMVAITPEPGSFALLGMGLVGLYGCRRRSRKAKAKAPDKNETA